MKITYLQLLEKVYGSIQPKKVKVGSATYTWNGCDYVLNTDSRRSLSDTLTSWTTKAQTTAEFIDVVEEILTDEEKEYLRAVIKPYRSRVKSIYKRVVTDGEYLKITIKYSDLVSVDYIALPIHKNGETYKGLNCGHAYTLEELDL